MDAAETPLSSRGTRPHRAVGPYHGGAGGPRETGSRAPISPGIPFTRLDAAVIGFTAGGLPSDGITADRSRAGGARGWNPLETKGER